MMERMYLLFEFPYLLLTGSCSVDSLSYVYLFLSFCLGGSVVKRARAGSPVLFNTVRECEVSENLRCAQGR